VIEAADGGNPVLRKIYAKAGWVLGMGISNLKRMFNPAKIIISGSGVGVGKLIFDPMFADLDHYRSSKTNNDSPIVVHNWDHSDYARGAGSLVLREVYKSPAHGIIPTI
jgi:predicted NBD/HSP70 family sugar kinase